MKTFSMNNKWDHNRQWYISVHGLILPKQCHTDTNYTFLKMYFGRQLYIQYINSMKCFCYSVPEDHIYTSPRISIDPLTWMSSLTQEGGMKRTKWWFKTKSCQHIGQARIRLTHWGWDKMAAIFHMTFSNGFSWMKMYVFACINSIEVCS